MKTVAEVDALLRASVARARASGATVRPGRWGVTRVDRGEGWGWVPVQENPRDGGPDSPCMCPMGCVLTETELSLSAGLAQINDTLQGCAQALGVTESDVVDFIRGYEGGVTFEPSEFYQLGRQWREEAR